MHCILSPPVYESNYNNHSINLSHPDSPNSVDQQQHNPHSAAALPLVPSPTSLSFSTHFNNKQGVSSSSAGAGGFLCPIADSPDGEIVLPIECGANQAILYLSKLCQGSKGPCIFFNGYWLTPNEFQYISGRETAKDWKRSIRHNGKSIKLLISKGVIGVHSPICECGNLANGTSGNHGSSAAAALKRMELLANNHNTFNSSTSASASASPTNSTYPRSPPQQQNRNGGGGGGSVKRESRLTSIIDHLLISRSNEAEYRSCGSGSSSSPPSESDSTGDIAPAAAATTISTSSSFLHLPQAASSESAEEDQPSSQLPPLQQQQQQSTTTTGMNASGGNTTTSINNSNGRIKTAKKRIKTERQSPESVRSSPSPPKGGIGNGIGGGGGGGSGGSDAPSPPLKQMEQMMSRNYSDFMRSLAAKYNHANPNELYSGRSSNSAFSFDTRFLKPGAAAAAASILAFQQQESKIPFPLIDMSSTQTLLSMVRSATANAAAAAAGTSNNNNNSSNSTGIPTMSSSPNSSTCTKRPSSPLDLSSAGQPGKKMKHPGKRCGSSCSGCSTESEAVASWSVEDVCRFVSTIDLCAEYVQAFREHSIDGSSLPLLTEDHLIQSMNMKLGPALKFKSTVAKKMGNCPVCIHCVHCHSSSIDHK